MRGIAIVALVSALALAGCGPTAPSSSGTPPANTTTQSAPTLSLTIGGTTRQFSAAELLARADATTITIPQDAAYHASMQYRAVPFRAVLASFPHDTADTLEISATDGFVAQMPRALADGGATPWIAVEDSAHPWPNLPGKDVSAGPFYLVWQDPQRGGVSPEQWPYQMAALTAVASPAQRWPALAVSASASAAARRGQTVFAANCLTCHRLAGSGEGNVGPDLMQPMPATAYFTDAGLRALIRNPAAVRTWPDQHMPAFAADAISDSDIDAVIAYLHQVSSQHSPPTAHRH